MNDSPALESAAVLIVTQDVDGAPVRMGELVCVTDTSEEASLDGRFAGRRGVVVALVYDEPRTQYPHAPLVKVSVEGLGEDLFFPWELERAVGWSWRRLSEPGASAGAC